MAWKSVILFRQKGPKGLTNALLAVKSRKRFAFVISSDSKGSTFTAVKRDANF